MLKFASRKLLVNALGNQPIRNGESRDTSDQNGADTDRNPLYPAIFRGCFSGLGLHDTTGCTPYSNETPLWSQSFISAIFDRMSILQVQIFQSGAMQYVTRE